MLNFFPNVTCKSCGAAHGADTFAFMSPLNCATKRKMKNARWVTRKHVRTQYAMQKKGSKVCA